MRELTYTILELEEWCSNNSTCDLCSNFIRGSNKAVCQIRARSKLTDKIVQNDMACEECKEKFENGELPKCDCGRLKTRYTCDCQEESQEKELPILPPERRQTAFYERQINGLREKERQLTEEVDTHLEALEVSEVWNKRQKQELLDRIKRLEEENKRLKDLTPQELLDEIDNLKDKVKQLEEQNNQLTSQVEIKEPKKWPWKLKK